MLDCLVFFVGVLLAAALFAMAEIHVEGPDGWAGKLPTWRKRNRWTRLFLGDKPLTGYHVYTFGTLLTLCHLPWFLGLSRPTWAAELRILSFFTFFCIVEDFLWFVLNPAFDIRRFRRDLIWWHRAAWWGFAPRDYFVFIPVGLFLYWLSRR